MRYLRLLTNSVVAGALGPAYLLVVILHLNPGIPLHPAALGPLYARLAIVYGSALVVGFVALLVVRDVLWRGPGMPGWLSLRILAWATTLVAAAAAALMWLNLSAFRAELVDETARRMLAGAAAMSASALLLSLIAVVHYSFGRRGSVVGGSLYVLAVVASLLLPMVARGWGETMRAAPARGARGVASGLALPGRVTMLLVDGASLEYITPATASGRLPNFGRLLDAGASMHLSTIRPTQSEPVWAATATGRYPPENGVRAAAHYLYADDQPPIEVLPDFCFAQALLRFGVLNERRLTSSALRVPALWDILSAAGVSVGVAGWPLTDPVAPVHGFLVGDGLHRRVARPPAAMAGQHSWPCEAATVADAVLRRYASAPIGGPAGGPPTWRDALYQDVFDAITQDFRPQVTAVRYESLDRAGHAYLRYAEPRAFGDVTDEERRRYGLLLDEYYAYMDSRIGAAIKQLGDEDLLLVVSGYGMEPVPPLTRIVNRVLGESNWTGTHDRGPEGFLLAYGAHVAPGRQPLGAVVDVVPTVLYYLGLPVARDMDGFARTDLFKRTFTAEHPLTFVPSYAATSSMSPSASSPASPSASSSASP
jgi:Type I phosphodiesterase / nucleotide pyrophosphatase